MQKYIKVLVMQSFVFRLMATLSSPSTLKLLSL